jgi:hypothetical protein
MEELAVAHICGQTHAASGGDWVLGGADGLDRKTFARLLKVAPQIELGRYEHVL